MNIAFALPPILVNPGSNEGQRARKVIRECASKVGSAKMRPQGVVFSIDGAFHPRASKIQNSTALRALLDCLIELNLICWDVCPNMKPFYETGVYYHLMPSGAAWETTPTLYRRGHGDCKSFVAARVAELRKAGKVAMPVFRHVTDAAIQRALPVVVNDARALDDRAPDLLAAVGRGGFECHRAHGLALLFPWRVAAPSMRFLVGSSSNRVGSNPSLTRHESRLFPYS